VVSDAIHKLRIDSWSLPAIGTGMTAAVSPVFDGSESEECVRGVRCWVWGLGSGVWGESAEQQEQGWGKGVHLPDSKLAMVL
jgi:hypothetical protein